MAASSYQRLRRNVSLEVGLRRGLSVWHIVQVGTLGYDGRKWQ